MKALLRITLLLAFSITFCTLAFCQTLDKVELAHEQLNRFINVRDFCISKHADEIYFTVQSPFQEVSQIAYMIKIKGIWSAPQLMPFSNKYSDLEPFLSPDQTKLYFASNRPLNDSTHTAKDYDIWYVTRQNSLDRWSEPINMGKTVNSKNDEFYPSISANNNLYFTSDVASGMGKDDIYFCKFQDGAYQTPKILDANINSNGYEFNAFISQNEDFLIYTKYNSDGGFGSGDLYISKKDKENNWTKAQNLGAVINTKFMEYCPFYHQEEETLYFTSKRNNIQPKKFENIIDLNQYMATSENGLSKIYKIKFMLE